MAREGIMELSPFTQKRFDKGIKETGYWLGQPKLNGTRLRWDPQAQDLFSSGAKIVNCLPHLKATMQGLGATYGAMGKLALDGEAYCHGMPLEDIRARSGRTKSLHEDHKALSFYIFDVISSQPQADRAAIIDVLATGLRHQHIVWINATPIYDLQQANDQVVDWVDQGFEGGVFRRPDCLWEPKRTTLAMKWKPKGRDKYEVVAIHEGEGKYAGTLGALTVRDNLGQEFNVGSFKCNDDKRAEYWAQGQALVGQMAVIEYCEITKGGIMPSGVFVMTLEEAGTDWKPKTGRLAA